MLFPAISIQSFKSWGCFHKKLWKLLEKIHYTDVHNRSSHRTIRETHTNTHGAWNDLSKCTYQLPTIVSIHVWTFKGMNMSELCCRHTGARTTHNTNLILVTRRSWVSVNPAAAPPSTVSASSPTHVALLNILTAYKVHAFHNRSASSTWSLTKTHLTIRWYWNLVMKIK